MTEKCVSIKVIGKVQGVFFRQSAREMAHTFRIKGEVQNMPDGTVLITASGAEEDLHILTEWCRKGGPPKATVSQVLIEEINPQTFKGFRIIH